MKTFLLSHRSLRPLVSEITCRERHFWVTLSWSLSILWSLLIALLSADAKKKNHNRMMRIRFTTTGCHGNFLTWSTLFDLAPPSRPRACWHLKRLKGLGIIEIGFRNWSKNMQYIVIERKLSYDETRKVMYQVLYFIPYRMILHVHLFVRFDYAGSFLTISTTLTLNSRFKKFTNQSRKSGSFSLSWDDNGIGNRTKRFAVLIIHVWSCPPLSLMIDKLICWSVWLSTAAGGGSGV